MNKLLIDIAQLLSKKAGDQLCKAYEFSQQANSKKESEACIEAVILFQACMEAIINEEIESHRLLSAVREENEEMHKKFRSLSFRNKWLQSYEVLRLQDKQEYLQNYLLFYTKFRVPITHPHSRFSDISLFTFSAVYEGIKNGWYAAHLLLTKLGKNYSHDTWEGFCERCGISINQ